MAKPSDYPFDLLDAEKRRVRTPQPLPADPVMDTVQSIERERTRQVIIRGGDPDRAANVTRLARQAGEAPASIEDRLDDVQRAHNASGLADRMAKYPAIGQHLAANPRTAVAAQDDHRSLDVLGSAWDFLKNPVMGFANWWDRQDAEHRQVGASGKGGFGVATPLMAGVAAIMGDPAAQKAVPRALRRAPQALYAGTLSMAGSGLGYVRGAAENGLIPSSIPNEMVAASAGQWSKRANAASASAMPHSDDWVTEQVLGGISNVPNTAASLAVGLSGKALGLSTRAAALLGSSTGGAVAGGQSYNTAREQGLSPGKAFAYANVDAATEVAGEYLGTRQFLKATDAGSNALTRFLKYQLGEQVGEQFSTVAQALSAWAVLPENRNKTLGDFAAQLPGEMAATAVQTLVAGGISHVAIAAVERLADLHGERRRVEMGTKITPRVQAAVQAFQEQHTIEQIGKGAEQSKLRSRDPEGFRSLMQSLADHAGASQVYIPAEAVDAYVQSDCFELECRP